jgi:hypothetical protein
MAAAFVEMTEHLARPPARLAEIAFLFGRAYGQCEAGMVDEVTVPEAEALVTDLAEHPDVQHQLDELQKAAREMVRRMSEDLRRATGVAHATDLLSQWEGFGRFCRDTLGMEPLTVTAAFGLQRDDPVVEVGKVCPQAAPDENEAAIWARSWGRRFAESRA